MMPMFKKGGAASSIDESSQEIMDRRREQQAELDEQLEEFLRQDPRSMKPLVMREAKKFKLTPPQIAALSIFGSEPSQAPNLMKTGPGMGRV